MTDVQYRRNLTDITPRDLRGFFVGWPDPPDAATHLDMLRNADAVSLAVAPGSGRVIGFAYAISDGILSAYIPLLEVLPDWQYQGIGTRLIEELCDELDDLYMIDLCCDADLEEFYRRLDFTSSTAMIRRNYDNQSGT